MSDDGSGWVPVLPAAVARRSLIFYCEILGFSEDSDGHHLVFATGLANFDEVEVRTT